jgi:hypothetical protein
MSTTNPFENATIDDVIAADASVAVIDAASEQYIAAVSAIADLDDDEFFDALSDVTIDPTILPKS